MKCTTFLAFLSPISMKRENMLDEIALGEKRYKNQEMTFVPVHIELLALTPELELAIGRINAIVLPKYSEEEFLLKLLGDLPDSVKAKMTAISK